MLLKRKPDSNRRCYYRCKALHLVYRVQCYKGAYDKGMGEDEHTLHQSMIDNERITWYADKGE